MNNCTKFVTYCSQWLQVEQLHQVSDQLQTDQLYRESVQLYRLRTLLSNWHWLTNPSNWHCTDRPTWLSNWLYIRVSVTVEWVDRRIAPYRVSGTVVRPNVAKRTSEWQCNWYDTVTSFICILGEVVQRLKVKCCDIDLNYFITESLELHLRNSLGLTSKPGSFINLATEQSVI